MAKKIRWNTIYDRLTLRGGQGESYKDIVTGTFVLIKMRGTLFFQDTINDNLYPISQVIIAKVA